MDSIAEGTVSKPAVIEQKGETPEQYPDYDDWDEFDDDADEYFDEEEVVDLEWKHLTNSRAKGNYGQWLLAILWQNLLNFVRLLSVVLYKSISPYN